ncbi:MAG TPA: hypothetical protein EYQ50_15250 [Verrucomicrobiales bacterium]|nr:hypothetical protein [Verrucomicrobiales bacterium]HIL72052.1 hypothetical protein [Verrucomicrobiota bacterium]
MRRIISTVGLAALGIASLNGQTMSSGMTELEQSRFWTISGSLRGFYDSNPTTAISSLEDESWGVHISPSVKFQKAWSQTHVGFSYQYDMKWYESRAKNSADHSHEFVAGLDHAFSERFQVSMSDSFVIAQEPEVIDGNTITTVPTRTNGDNIRNTAEISGSYDFSDKLGSEIRYSNRIYNYDESGVGSRSAILDRMQHLVGLDLRWQVVDETVAVLGYQYGNIHYTSDDGLDAGDTVDADTRDSDSHFIFVGMDRQFGGNFSAHMRVGAQYTDYDEIGDDEWNPYIDNFLRWAYRSESYLTFGTRVARNQTDVALSPTGQLTLDQESTVLYSTVNHQITAKLSANLIGQYQNSEFNGGAADGDEDELFLAGLNLSYDINQFLTAETGYNYDKLNSDQTKRGYNRSRVYLGLRATY